MPVIMLVTDRSVAFSECFACWVCWLHCRARCVVSLQSLLPDCFQLARQCESKKLCYGIRSNAWHVTCLDYVSAASACWHM